MSRGEIGGFRSRQDCDFKVLWFCCYDVMNRLTNIGALVVHSRTADGEAYELGRRSEFPVDGRCPSHFRYFEKNVFEV